MKTNASMTVYNKIFDKETRLDKYISYQVPKVLWNSKSTAVLNQGLENANTLTVYIFDEEKYSVNIGDILVKGLVSDEITTQKQLEDKYKEVFNVTSVDYVDIGSRNTNHYEIGGQ